MKANKFFIYSVTSLLALPLISSDLILTLKHIPGRMPASDNIAVSAPEKKAITEKEMKSLKDALLQAEVKLKETKSLLDQKAIEIDLSQQNIDETTRLLILQEVDQASDVRKLKNEITGSIIKELEIKPVPVECKSESKGEKLEADIKKLLNDKEEIISKIEILKKEKYKNVMPNSEYSQAENYNVMGLMSQMTTMFTTQMQLQMQMMSMFSQMQMSMSPQLNSQQYLPQFTSSGMDFNSMNKMNNYNNNFGYPIQSENINPSGLRIG
ncbi:MAG: hypothetical protein Q7U04_16580, partial [Bacteriovorax sp.]|nr:hypothetical protein [Bacteriovorax sp.]